MCFWNHCKLQLKTATCNMSLATCTDFFPDIARQVARKIASCNIILKEAWHYFENFLL